MNSGSDIKRLSNRLEWDNILKQSEVPYVKRSQ